MFLGIALKRLICLVFLVCNIFIYVIEYAPSDCFYWTFLPGDAMHPRYLQWACVCLSVCLSVSVCHKSEFY